MINYPILFVDNFFDEIDFLVPHLKKIPLYNQKDYNEKFKDNQTWPGMRSQDLVLIERPLCILLRKKFNELKLDFPERWGMRAHLHLRTAKDEVQDWIHKDDMGNCFRTCLVYLSETNLESGTKFYLEKDKPESLFADMKLVKNSACIFDASIFHKSGLNYGNDINDGKFTLNIFFYDVKKN